MIRVVSQGLPGRQKRADKVRPVRCQICGSKNTIPGLDLEHQPVSDAGRTARPFPGGGG